MSRYWATESGHNVHEPRLHLQICDNLPLKMLTIGPVLNVQPVVHNISRDVSLRLIREPRKYKIFKAHRKSRFTPT